MPESTRRISRTLALLSAAAMILPASASAGIPETKYACYGEGNIFISTLKIKSQEKYNYLGENGKFTYRASSQTLKFKSGALKPWVGGLFNTDGDPAIELVTDQAGGQIVQCSS